MTALTRRYKVLVVDDDQDCAEEMAELIACHDCETRIATTLATAWAARDNFGPDAIILDLGLGSDSGLDLVHSLRAAGGPIPCLVLVSGRELTPMEIAELGPTPLPLLLKPADTNRLMQIIMDADKNP